MIFIVLQASELCLVEGVRGRQRGRIGFRHHHRHHDTKHEAHTDHVKTAVNIFDVDHHHEDDSLELLQGAENGRYKVVAKAEPYKNLPVGSQ